MLCAIEPPTQKLKAANGANSSTRAKQRAGRRAQPSACPLRPENGQMPRAAALTPAWCSNLSATPLVESHCPVAVSASSQVSSARRSASSSTSISSRGLRRKITRAPARSASPQCLVKLPSPKCDGNSVGGVRSKAFVPVRSEEHTSELQSRLHLVCRLLL